MRLIGSKLDPLAISSLAKGAWPKLGRLNLSQSELGAPAIQELIKADWPNLESLYITLDAPQAQTMRLLGIEGAQVQAVVKRVAMAILKGQAWGWEVDLESETQLGSPRGKIRTYWPKLSHLKLFGMQDLAYWAEYHHH